MHDAPSVSYPVGRPLFAGLLAGMLWSAGAAVSLSWVFVADTPGWRHALAALAVAAAGTLALLSWLRSASGDLHWDGARWTVPGQVGAGSLEVALDLQQRLLVHWRGQGRSRWLWLERHRCPHRWPDLRRGVYSRARPQALSPARPPAATP